MELLGSPQPLTWTQHPAALLVQLPPQRPTPYGSTLKITLANEG